MWGTVTRWLPCTSPELPPGSCQTLRVTEVSRAFLPQLTRPPSHPHGRPANVPPQGCPSPVSPQPCHSPGVATRAESGDGALRGSQHSPSAPASTRPPGQGTQLPSKALPRLPEQVCTHAVRGAPHATHSPPGATTVICHWSHSPQSPHEGTHRRKSLTSAWPQHHSPRTPQGVRRLLGQPRGP